MSDIVVKNLSKIYNPGHENEVRAIDDVSFSIKEGEFAVILGPSGAGKSTILNILGGMDTPSSGTFLLGDKEVSSFKEKELALYRRNDVGFVFQFYNLLPNLNCLENVEIAASLVKNPFDAQKVLEDVGLSARARNFPSQLSGGEQQRTAIARAIVKNPGLLLCDEPTGALDSKTGASILSLLYDLGKQYNKTVIMVTHNAKIAEVATHLIRVS
ncbi:MAG: ABC transporter ATP-binding protein, partial [Bacilli bacterium]|nr:ABC transporter ATP-binding protein [Bacilli bacterium]